MTFRNWEVYCPPCDLKFRQFAWSDKLPIPCTDCGQPTHLWTDKMDKAPGIITDDIPGGEMVDHLYATPRKFYSKTDIKRACNELGWTRKGDSPQPYRIPWSGKKIEPERPAPLVGNAISDKPTQ